MRNRSRDKIWGPRGLDHLSSSRTQSRFCSCPVISLKRPAGARKISFFSFFFFLFIWFDWRIITLQYCAGFLHSSASTGHRRICVPPPEHPFHLSPHSVHPSCARALSFGALLRHQFALVMCFTYGHVHVSMLFSQIIPPLTSLTEYKSLFFTSVSLMLPCM